MATRLFSRSITPAKLAISRSFASLSVKSAPSHFSLRPLIAAAANFRVVSPSLSAIRGFATRETTSSLNDSSPNWSNRPPKETILLDGCDFEHWLVVVEKPADDLTRDDIIDSYIKTLATVVGSEDEARMKIYSVSTKHYFAFGALVSEELSYKLKELPHVRWVLPDSYLNVKNKDYGGEPFINGQAVPYDPKYHEEWVKNNINATERNRRNNRPKNFDRSRNFERRENVQQRMGPGGPSGNMGSPQYMGGAPRNMGPPQNMGAPPGNMGSPQYMGGAPGNMGPPRNMGGAPNMGPPHNMGGHPGNMAPPPTNMGGYPSNMGHPSNMGGPQGNMGPPRNMGSPSGNIGGPQYNMGGSPENYVGGPPQNNMRGLAPPSNGPNFQQRGVANSGGMPYNSNPANMGGGNQYQTQDMPGRDMPNYQ